MNESTLDLTVAGVKYCVCKYWTPLVLITGDGPRCNAPRGFICPITSCIRLKDEPPKCTLPSIRIEWTQFGPPHAVIVVEGERVTKEVVDWSAGETRTHIHVMVGSKR